RADFLRRHFLVVAVAADSLGDGKRGVDAEIGGDEQLLQLVERRLIELPLREDAGDAVRNGSRRACEPFLHPLKEGTLLLLLLHFARLVHAAHWPWKETPSWAAR